jgi:hypothetical protein
MGVGNESTIMKYDNIREETKKRINIKTFVFIPIIETTKKQIRINNQHCTKNSNENLNVKLLIVIMKIL